MILLTRYLYIEQDVLAALFLSILEKKKDEALFWAYELYYSGFEDHVAKFLSTVYHQSFRSLHPRLKKHIDQWELDCISKPESIGNMVVNMCSPARKYDITFYLFSTMPADINTNLNETKIIINIHTRDILPYQTIDHTKEIRCKILSKVCLYEVRKDTVTFMNCSHKSKGSNELFIIQTQQWLYYASFSPIWANRIAEFGGKIDHETKKVEFEEDYLQEFYDLYGYEPDEQSKIVLSKMCHLNPVPQIGRGEFAKRYGCTVKKLPRKKSCEL